MRRAPATAKLNLALVVGPRREDGNHEVATVLQRLDLADRIAVEPARALRVEGFREDTLVRRSLEALAEASRTAPRWAARIWKHIPVASGLGGGSSDAATALRLANETLPEPLRPAALQEVASGLGADVPFFLTAGPQLAEGAGADLSPLDLPQDYWVLLILPHGAGKPSSRRSSRATKPSTRAEAPRATRSGGRSSTRPWLGSNAHGTSRRCRRTTSRRRRWPTSCASTARSGRT